MSKSPILHIIVVGFHHKKGCQVEFSYPPLVIGTEGKNECPSGWKYLPTLALPDGSHNFTEDSIFFNLPSLIDPTESVYGISCYRQIPVEKLKIVTADVTRSTVQKSVCVLTQYPLYGYIEVKISLIADAFFEQGDFSRTDILIKAYEQLNACILNDYNPMRHLEVGLSLRDIILKWRHKTLILFKLLMLQKRIVCFGSPVRSMCSLILVISSLYPKLLEKGFKEVACVRTSRPMSPMPDFSTIIQNNRNDNDDHSNENNKNDNGNDDIVNSKNKFERISSEEKYEEKIEANEGESTSSTISSVTTEIDVMPLECNETITNSSINKSQSIDSTNVCDVDKKQSSNSDRHPLSRDASVDTLASTMFPLSSISPDLWNAPIPIYSSGHLCLPYLSLPYMDLLTDPSVLSYVIGTSNILFHQKKNLADVQVDVENCTLETTDQDLKRQLTLTTEDLRFFDFIMKHVHNPKEGAEGSESWVREQFQGYILALLRTAVIPDNPKDCDHFNANYMSALKKTQCFQDWYNSKPDDSFFEGVPSGHPFAGTLSVTDMKLKLAQTMHNTESGRKINQAVNTTSRAVGGAISQAKGAFSNWWSSITTTNAVAATTLQHQNEILSTTTSNGGIHEKNDENHGKSSVINDNKKNEDLSSNEKCDNNICETTGLKSNNVNLNNDSDGIQKKDEGIIEIAKEAELLDKNRKIGDIFTV